MKNTAVFMQDISKTFPGLFQTVVANNKVNLQVNEGEFHVIVGENGAGKSTLMNILYGLLEPDEGKIFIHGKNVSFSNPKDAIQHGIGMIHQHFMLVPSFTIGENFVLGKEPTKLALLDEKKINEDLKNLAKELGLFVDPNILVEEAPVGVQQRVEILKAVYRGAQILILDEPTAVLTPQEIDVLFRALMKFCEQGKTILMITHKLPEVMKVADRVTVLRDGNVVGCYESHEINMEMLAEKMTGREWFPNRFERINREFDTPAILNVSNLTCLDRHSRPVVDDVTFQLHKGEILAIAGIANNGQTELAEALMGQYKIHSGNVKLEKKDISKSTVMDIRSLGIGHVPDDRYGEGCAKQASISKNMLMASHHSKPYSNLGILNIKEIKKFTMDLINNYKVKINHHEMPIESLSGGNVQKAIVAREINLTSRCLIAEQPSRGIDIGAAEYIYERLIELRNQGVAILLISLELSEILRLSDRILVIYDGRIVGERDPNKTTPKELGLLMTGAIEG